MSARPETKPSASAFFAAFAAIYFIWGSTYLGIRVAVETIPPFAMASVRFILAGGVLLAIVRSRGVAWPTLSQCRDNFVVGTFLLLGGNGLVAWAEQTLPSGITALIIGVQPVFMVLTEWAWPGGKRPTRLTFVGLLLGFLGVAWLSAPWESSQKINLGALLAVIGACISWAFGSIRSRHVRNPAPPFLASALQMLGGGLSLLVAALITGEASSVSVAAISQRSIVAFVYLTLIGSLVGFSTFVWLMKHSTPARVSTYAYVNPVVAVFLGWWLLGEPINHRTIMGALLILAGVMIITFQKTKKALPPDTNLSPKIEAVVPGASPLPASRRP